MGRMITTFAAADEFEKARDCLESLGLPYQVITPDPAYGSVGRPALVLSEESRMAIAGRNGGR